MFQKMHLQRKPSTLPSSSPLCSSGKRDSQCWTCLTSVSTAATLTIAGKALQGQLEVCSKQPAHSTYAGYTSLQGKQRLEYRPGDAVLGRPGCSATIGYHSTTAQLHCYAVIFECSRYIRDRQPDVLYEWFIRWFNFLTMTPEA